ncbi:unknown similar to XecnGV orf72 [Mythimna separata entomopoxvirus 'L']|uniref:Uncharacterized protein n=1 Tax=Mythimna separata entomopoxvirus 'L' TaxID=1293572 RepID=A0A916KQJ2_9POXV|nr:unknown similar to XecnGV orf72 [Mythimna separata entomopoxvirus 'L']CCU56361.1 unknown similar to XecnGV orf72 [Mythimna separata entomopoxvirus 'L']
MRKILLLCFITTTMAWLPPERCAQSSKDKPDPNPIHAVTLSTNIKDIADMQHATLKEKYKQYKFFGVPAQLSCVEAFASKVKNCSTLSDCSSETLKSVYTEDDAFISVFSPYNCQFYTYDPELLSSVLCHSTSCKLSRTVSTVDTYTPTEGYNWGVTIYGKASFLDFFEVGGEASTGGAYSCTYTKGKTTTDEVECSVDNGKNGHLQLYNVKSDMQCDFGSLSYFLDFSRDNDGDCLGLSSNTFTHEEATKIGNSKLELDFEPCLMTMYLLDMDKISEGLLTKLSLGLPKYNPFIDPITMHKVGNVYQAVVIYVRHAKTAFDLKKIIPFTNKAGNSVYQYACLLNPL